MKIQEIDLKVWNKLTQYGVKDWDIENKKREALRYAFVNSFKPILN